MSRGQGRLRRNWVMWHNCGVLGYCGQIWFASAMTNSKTTLARAPAMIGRFVKYTSLKRAVMYNSSSILNYVWICSTGSSYNR